MKRDNPVEKFQCRIFGTLFLVGLVGILSTTFVFADSSEGELFEASLQRGDGTSTKGCGNDGISLCSVDLPDNLPPDMSARAQLLQQYHATLQENIELKERLSILENQIGKHELLEAELQQKTNELNHLTRQQSRQDKKEESLSVRLEKKIKVLQEQNDKLRQRSKDTSGALDSSQLRQEKASLELEIQKLAEESDSQIRSLTRQIEDLQQQNQQWRAQAELASGQIREVTSSQKDTIALERELNQMKEKLVRQDAALKNQVEQLSAQSVAVTQLQKDKESLNAILVKQTNQLNLEVRKQLQLRVDNEALNAELRKKTDAFNQLTIEQSQFRKDQDNFEKTLSLLETERRQLKTQNQEQKEKIAALESEASENQSELYARLGTAYVKAELFELAIDAYEESLRLDEENPEVHYNLGLLYYHSLRDNALAIQHFQKYLKSEPSARNRKEVDYMIKMLK